MAIAAKNPAPRTACLVEHMRAGRDNLLMLAAAGYLGSKLVTRPSMYNNLGAVQAGFDSALDVLRATKIKLEPNACLV